MFTNKLEIINSSTHIVTQVFKHISISFQLSTNICIEVFLFNNKVIKFIQALTSRFIMRNITFIKSIERIYLYYLCRSIKTMYLFNRWYILNVFSFYTFFFHRFLCLLHIFRTEKLNTSFLQSWLRRWFRKSPVIIITQYVIQ